MPPRRDPTKIPNPYKSVRAKAWRNAMVAAINAGLEQGLFGLAPDENLWPSTEPSEGHERPRGTGGAVYRFTFPGGVPALAWIGDAGFGELSVHVALWPTEEAERWVRVNNAGRLAGEVWATGWLERKIQPYLQTSASLFTGARIRVLGIAEAEIEPRDASFVDRGTLQF